MESEEFLRVWQECKYQMRRRIMNITRNGDIAEDLLQEAFVRTYAHAEKLDGGAAKYLMTSATNLAFDYLRRIDIWHMAYQLHDQLCEETPDDLYCERERRDFFCAIVAPAILSLQNYNAVEWDRISRRYWERIPRSNVRVGQVLRYGTVIMRQESDADGRDTRARISDDFVRRQVEEAAQRVIELA